MPTQALEGVTLLDLGTVINGPLGCALVAELGARVIRIEAPGGDWGRMGLPFSAHRTMAGSECICLDLKTPEGQEIMGKLAAKADLLLHSMRPGAPERTGIGYEQLREINSNLVYLYAGGYGSTGPYSHRPSMAPIAGAVSGGGVAQMGRDAFPPPDQPMTIDEIAAVAKQLKRANDGTADHSTAMVNAVGLVLGLYARERTGQAQYVESTMINANAYLNIDDFYWHEGKQPRPLPDPEGYGLHALYRLYRASEGWVFLACLFDDEWHDWAVRSVGRQPDRRPAGPGDGLRIEAPGSLGVLEDLMYAMQVGTYRVSNSPLLYIPRTHGVEQAAVWIAGADPRYDDVAAALRDERMPAQYAVAFALVYCDLAGIDVRSRRIWADRERVFGPLRDQGLNVWYRLQTR